MRWQEMEQKANKAMLKVLGYTVLFAVIILAVVQVIAHADQIDSNGRMVFNVLGFLFLASCGVIWAVKRITGKV